MVRIIAKREGDTETTEDPAKRTRLDDADPGIVFSPGPSPYQNQQQSSWTVVRNSVALNGSAVTTNRTDALLSFTFPGDSLTLGLLYKASGTKFQVKLENGTSSYFEVTAAEATASAPYGDKQAFQKTIFHLTGLSCTNHTATLSPLPLSEGKGGDANEISLFFDWFSFPSSDQLRSCSANSNHFSATSVPTDGSNLAPNDGVINRPPPSTTHDPNTMYAGIGVGAAVLGFTFALLVVRLLRRRQHRQPLLTDPIDRSYRPTRKHTSDETVNLPLTVSNHSALLTHEPEPVFRPRGIHAFAQNASLAEGHNVTRPGTMESASAITMSPLMPIPSASYPRQSEDVGFSIGSALMGLQHSPANVTADWRNSGSKLQFVNPRASPLSPVESLSHVDSSSTLVDAYAIQRMSNSIPALNTAPATNFGKTKASSPYKLPRRPKTASAADRLRQQASQLDVQRPLSPFDRTGTTTISGVMRGQHALLQPRLATAPASSSKNKFRRNSIGSGDTHWSAASAEASALESHKERECCKTQLDIPNIEKTTDSEAEMWISKAKILEQRRRRRNSMGGTSNVPKRPPKSPQRPSTSHAALEIPSYQPFTIG